LMQEHPIAGAIAAGGLATGAILVIASARHVVIRLRSDGYSRFHDEEEGARGCKGRKQGTVGTLCESPAYRHPSLASAAKSRTAESKPLPPDLLTRSRPEYQLQQLASVDSEARADAAALRHGLVEHEVAKYRREAAERIRVFNQGKRQREATMLAKGSSNGEFIVVHAPVKDALPSFASAGPGLHLASSPSSIVVTRAMMPVMPSSIVDGEVVSYVNQYPLGYQKVSPADKQLENKARQASRGAWFGRGKADLSSSGRSPSPTTKVSPTKLASARTEKPKNGKLIATATPK